MKEVIKKLLREGLIDEEIISGKYYHGSPYPKLEWGLAPEDYNRALFGYGIYITTNQQEAISYALENREKAYLFSMNLTGLNVVNFHGENVSDDIKNKLEKIPNFYSLFYAKFEPNLFDFEKLEYSLGDDIYYDWDFYDNESGDINDKPEGYFLMKWVNGKVVDEIYGLKPEEILTILNKSNDVGKFNSLYYEDANIEIERNKLFDEYNYLYFYLTKLLKSSKETSKLLASMGIDGFKTKGVGADNVQITKDDYIVNIINPSKLTNVKTKIVTQKDIERYV